MDELSWKARTAIGRYPCGEETKQRIVDVAVEIFGRQGFAGTSTRDIALSAAVNKPAIQYYFGSKSGLYHVCIDQLTSQVSQRIEPAVIACRADVQAGKSLPQLIRSLSDVQDCLIECFFSEREGLAIRRLLAWEDVENEENRSNQYMKERVGFPILEIFRLVIQRFASSEMPQNEIGMHALSMMGLSMIFHFNQSRLMDTLSWSSEDALLSTLKSVANKQLAYALTGLSKDEKN